MIATDNVAGGLLDLQAAGRLSAGIDPIDVALAIGDRYQALWNEITFETTATIGDAAPMQQRLRRLNDLGFDVEEMEIVTDRRRCLGQFHSEGRRTRPSRRPPRQSDRASSPARTRPAACSMTSTATAPGCRTNPTDRSRSTSPPCGGSTACSSRRWRSIPTELLDRLEAAEIFHQLLEHRWYMAERAGSEVPIERRRRRLPPPARRSAAPNGSNSTTRPESRCRSTIDSTPARRWAQDETTVTSRRDAAGTVSDI